jgi:hypothetical protein
MHIRIDSIIEITNITDNAAGLVMHQFREIKTENELGEGIRTLRELPAPLMPVTHPNHLPSLTKQVRIPWKAINSRSS